MADFTTLIPSWAGTVAAVGSAVFFFLIALAIVRFAKALGGVVGAGAGLVGASGLLPWVKVSNGGQTVSFDAWHNADQYVNVRLLTGIKATSVDNWRWGYVLVVTALLMLILGVLPGRLGLFAILPSLVVPYVFLWTLALRNPTFKIDNVGYGMWAALGGSVIVILAVVIRALQTPSRSHGYGQGQLQPYPQQQYQQPYQPYPQQPYQPQQAYEPTYQQPAYGQQPYQQQPYQQQPQYGQPAPEQPPAEGGGANDGHTQIIQSPYGQQPPRE